MNQAVWEAQGKVLNNIRKRDAEKQDQLSSPINTGATVTDDNGGSCCEEVSSDSSRRKHSNQFADETLQAGWVIVAQPRTNEEEESSHASSSWDVVSTKRRMPLALSDDCAVRSVQSLQESSSVNFGKENDQPFRNEASKMDFVGVHLDLTKSNTSLHRATDDKDDDDDDEASSMSESSICATSNRSVACPHGTLVNNANKSSLCGLSPLDAPSLTADPPDEGSLRSVEERDRLLAMQLQEENLVEESLMEELEREEMEGNQHMLPRKVLPQPIQRKRFAQRKRFVQQIQHKRYRLSKHEARGSRVGRGRMDPLTNNRSRRILAHIMRKIMAMIVPNNNDPTTTKHYRNVGAYLPSTSDQFFALREKFRAMGKPVRLLTAFCQTNAAVHHYHALLKNLDLDFGYPRQGSPRAIQLWRDGSSPLPNHSQGTGLLCLYFTGNCSHCFSQGAECIVNLQEKEILLRDTAQCLPLVAFPLGDGCEEPTTTTSVDATIIDLQRRIQTEVDAVFNNNNNKNNDAGSKGRIGGEDMGSLHRRRQGSSWWKRISVERVKGLNVRTRGYPLQAQRQSPREPNVGIDT